MKKEEGKSGKGKAESVEAQLAISTPDTRCPTPCPCVLAIDPGTAKCGVAVVRADGHILHRAIVPTGEIVEQARTLIAARKPTALVCGNGTGSKSILRDLRLAELPVPLVEIEESHTSEAARVRFVRENRPPLLHRLLPRSLRTPWLPYDDYVAMILAERYWQSASLCGDSAVE